MSHTKDKRFFSAFSVSEIRREGFDEMDSQQSHALTRTFILF
jgi:hypothetical protein